MAIPKVTSSEAELDSVSFGGKPRRGKNGHKGDKHHARKHKKRRRRGSPAPARKPAAAPGVAPTGSAAAPSPAPPPPAPSAAVIAEAAAGESRPVASFAGSFGPAQATRLLARAGFGPTPGQANALVSLGLVGAVQSLTRPSGTAVLTGPPPTDDEGNPIAPADIWGHNHLWWLDRMVRTDQPLVERMALVFHDWFATSEASVSKPQQMIDQSNVFRNGCFGSFLDLFKAVTIDPAMLQWLNGAENNKDAPNENYAREMMELFSLGADRGAYSEDDIREQARALTGWTYEWSDAERAHNFHFEPRDHDTGAKTVFGKSGNWGWEDACRLCVENPLHPSFFVEKLWSYFVPTPPSSATRDRMVGTYLSSGLQIRTVLEEVLLSPDFYEGPPMVKPPIVQLASMMRCLGRHVDTDAWTWLAQEAGQQLFWPPNVSGWDDEHWLDTSRTRARWNVVDYVLDGTSLPSPWSEPYSETENAEEALDRAVAAWGYPELRPEHRAELLAFAQRAEGLITANWQRTPYRAMRQNALLQLIGVSPDSVLQ